MDIVKAAVLLFSLGMMWNNIVTGQDNLKREMETIKREYVRKEVSEQMDRRVTADMQIIMNQLDRLDKKIDVLFDDEIKRKEN